VKNKSSSALDTWLTPASFYEKINERFNFDDFDPSPPNCDLTKFNGLLVEWPPRTFCNPPYSRADKEAFLLKGYQESLLGKLAVFLVPVSTSTAIFHDLILPNARVEFLRGRLKFEGIDRDGNWINPGMGMYQMLDVPKDVQQLSRSGQNDLMLVIFGEEIAASKKNQLSLFDV
jgi:site-specific DNA-methyltransferase (adenine-specific)